MRVGTRERLGTLFATPPRKVWLSPFSCAPITMRSHPSLTEGLEDLLGRTGFDDLDGLDPVTDLSILGALLRPERVLLPHDLRADVPNPLLEGRNWLT